MSNLLPSFQKFVLLFVGIFLSSCSYIEFIPKERPAMSAASPEISNVLLNILNQQEQAFIDSADYDSTSLKDIITLGTPEGIRLKLRLTRLSISMVEAIKLSRDQEMLSRLYELVQWSERLEVRSQALTAIAHFSKAEDLGYFKTALADKEIGIRLAAIEALQKWGREEGFALLREQMREPWSPIGQIMAAQALLSHGDRSGIDVLYKLVQDRSWIVRAMAARYLGDYADPKDYKKLFRYFDRETRSDFALAELAIAVLKLLSKTEEDISYTPNSSAWDKDKVSYLVTDDNIVEMEPLVIVPPRLFVPESVRISETINNRLINLIKNRLDVPLTQNEKSDPNLETLVKMLTPRGVALQARYDALSVLVVQGLGGTFDPRIRTELRALIETSPNDLTRASSLLAIAYAKKEIDEPLIQDALDSSNPIIRFGGMEAVLAGRFESMMPSVINMAFNDPVPAFRIFAMRILMGFGNELGTSLMRSDLRDPDWPARAMRFWYLGRFGDEKDFVSFQQHLGTETNLFVLSELALGSSRLAPLTQ